MKNLTSKNVGRVEVFIEGALLYFKPETSEKVLLDLLWIFELAKAWL